MNSRISRKIKKTDVCVGFRLPYWWSSKGHFISFSIAINFLIEMNVNIASPYNALLIWVKRFSEYLAYEI